MANAKATPAKTISEKSESDPKAGQDAAARKDRLLRAAEECFAESGFHGARMAQIAKRAGISPGLIYHYFDSKEQIIAEIIQEHTDAKLQNFREYEASEAGFLPTFIERLSEGLAKATDPFWSLLTLEITAEATRNEAVRDIVKAGDQALRQAVTRCLKNDHDDWPDLDSRIDLFVAALQGLGIRAIRNPDLNRDEVLTLLREITEQLFRRP